MKIFASSSKLNYCDSASHVDLLHSIIKVEPEEIPMIPSTSSSSQNGNQIKVCDLCSRFFYTQQDIEHHMESIHVRPTFDCNLCDFKGLQRGILETHKKIHAVQNECLSLNQKLTMMTKRINDHKEKIMCLKCKNFLKSEKNWPR